MHRRGRGTSRGRVGGHGFCVGGVAQHPGVVLVLDVLDFPNEYRVEIDCGNPFMGEETGMAHARLSKDPKILPGLDELHELGKVNKPVARPAEVSPTAGTRVE